MRDLIEHWTVVGLRKLKGMRADFLRMLKAKADKEPPSPPVDCLLRRWTADELKQVKAYLEAKPGSEWSFDDHMLSIEWIHQRWWPAEEIRTAAQWEVAKATYAQRLRHSMAFYGPSDSLIEQEAQRRQDQLFRTYRLSLADFGKLVIPVVLKHPCSPDSFDDETVARLWRTTSPSKFERRDARDELGFWPTPLEVINTAESLGCLAQSLLAARAAGHREVRLYVLDCECRDPQANSTWTVEELLKCFENITHPILPPNGCACLNPAPCDECRAWCAMCITPLDRARQPPVDPAFERALDEIAERHSANWA